METVKYPIPRHHLATTIESFKELAFRLEQAQTVREAYEYFLHL